MSQFPEGEAYDELDDQSLESDFLASLTANFPPLRSWFGMDSDTNDVNQTTGDGTLKSVPSIKIDFKERDRLRDDANYDVWAIRMKGFLKESSLWDVVTGNWQDQSLLRGYLGPLKTHLLHLNFRNGIC